MTFFLVAAASAVPTAHAFVTSASAAASGVPASQASSPTIGSFVLTVVPSFVASALPSGVTTTAPVTAGSVTMPLGLELAAVFAGALAGGLVAVERKFDVVGLFTVAILSGLGGGIIRDVLLQKYGVAALSNNWYLATAIVAGLLAFFFTAAAARLRPLLFLIDAVSLGLFAVVGADKALRAGLVLIPAVLLGAITSVGGGLLRDLMSGETPQLMKPGTMYGLAAATGSVVYVALVGWLDITKPWAAAAAVAVAVVLRLLSTRLGWQTPTPTDLTPMVTNLPSMILPTRKDDDNQP